MIYANPQTDNVGEVEKKYLQSDAKNADSNSLISRDTQYLQKQFLQLKDYARIIDFVEKEEKGTFLEIGSYAGTFLNEARKKGWKVLGIEPLELPADYSENQMGIPVIRKYFEQADIPKGSISVAVACHVIEHVPDPASFVKKAYESLKPGGKLILETPTYDHLMFKIFKHRERSVRCDGHIYFFTKETLTKLVENNGFRVLKHENVGRTLTLDRLFYNLEIMAGRKIYFSKISKKLRLEKIVVRLNTKDMQRIYCEKIQSGFIRQESNKQEKQALVLS